MIFTIAKRFSGPSSRADCQPKARSMVTIFSVVTTKIPQSKPKPNKEKVEKKKLEKEKIDYLKFVVMENFKVDDGERFGQTVPGIFGRTGHPGDGSVRHPGQ